mmetsp:Transcript_1213/g.2931  ORF Transcript_1213/g.2931 Transcript_1213/m.2931 type:complete len:359 (+) Transcript_1213:96-1172(+)
MSLVWWKRVLSSAVEVRESKRGAENAGRLISGQMFPSAGKPELGVFASQDLDDQSCVGFLKADYVFSAPNVLASSTFPLIGFASDALQGYESLRTAKPALFNSIELALFLWMERRAEGLGFTSESWASWTADLPDCCPGNGAFQTAANVEKLLPPSVQTKLSVEDKKSLLTATQQYDKFVGTFSEALERDLIDALQIIEAEGGTYLWGRGDPQKQNWPFEELFREELSLILSRGIDFRQVKKENPLDQALAAALGDFAILPGLDFVNHSDQPNAEIVLAGGQERPSSWLTDCSGDLSSPSGVALRLTRPVTAGEEILINYGPGSGRDYLFRYGFVDGEPEHFMQTPNDKTSPLAVYHA